MPVEIPDELRETRADAARILRRRDALVAQPLDRAGRERLGGLDRELLDVLDRLRLDPCDASAEVPLVLLPVRVECKRAGSTLRVRITPDEIHVDALARTLSDDEAQAGRAYWRAVWADAASAVPWSDLRDAVGPARAGWVARALAPVNLPLLGTGDPEFPEVPAEVADGSVARCLPDRFVVSVVVGGGAPIVVTGPPVPRDLPLSPIALADDDVVDIDGLRVPVGSEWSVSFDRAKEVGLGIEVPLPRGATVVDSVVVVGTRNSVSEKANAEDFAQLLVSHAYSDGVDLLPHGTPTNNADTERSAYRAGASAVAPALTPPVPSEQARAAAALLGVSPEVMESLLDPAATRSTLESAQRAANTALWWATWEFVLNKVDAADIPAVTPATIESARRLHRDSVRGAGHSSALRVGAQPYGILPVTDLDRWKPSHGDISASLQPLVRRVLARWAARAERLSRVRPGDDVSDAALLEMLGMSPVSTGVRARPALDGPQVSTLAPAVGAPASMVAAEAQLAKAIMSQYSVDMGQRLAAPVVDTKTRLIALPYVSARDAEVITTIVADGSPSVDSVLQALLDVAWDEAKGAQRRAAPDAFVSPLLDFLAPGAQVAAFAKAAMSSTSIDAAVAAAPAESPDELFAAASALRSTVHFAGQPTEGISLAAIEPVAEARTSLAQVALDLGDTPEARWIGQEAIAGYLEWFAMRWEARDAMLALGAMPIEERRIAVASALDIASHRADAWATGIAAARHATLATGEGMTIGAFGYIEDIRLGAAAREPEGWLHAPSPSHAVAEGVLASAHRSRIGATAGSQPFAIDLSSRRGAQLRRVLEGMRRGQRIGAMLGYQIERALTRSAARFQLTLRQLAPLDTPELGNDAASRGRTARMAAADVVDGVELLRLFPIDGLDGAAPALRRALADKPLNAYIDGDWPAPTDEEWAMVRAALRGASETLDAVSDALLAESVLHYVSGNPSRAAAAMDAAGSGAAVDPDLDVLASRQPGRTLTHNALVLIPEGATGWSSTRPRAIAEPRLEAWAARRLGDPADIVVSDGAGGRLTLADAGFAALDLVFADDLVALERDLRAALPGMGDLATTRAAGWPKRAHPVTAAATLAGALRGIAAGASPVTPDRLVGPGDPAQHAIDRAELLGRCQDLLTALAEALGEGEAVIAAIDPIDHAVDEADVDAVRAAVAPLAAFGVTMVPNPAIPSDAAWAVGAWEGASARFVSASQLLAEIEADPELSDDQVLTRVVAVTETILGDGFPMLPVNRHLDGEPVDLDDALRRPLFAQPPPAALSAFVRDHATVHAGMGRLAEAQLLGGALGHPVPLTAIQLTLRDADGRALPGTDRWLAGALPDGLPWPARPVSHVVVELVGSPSESADDVAGLLFDSWVEALPFQPDPRATGEQGVDTPLRDARATTGLAVHAHQASARAPQVILSAVSPDGSRWTTESVVAAVRSAVALSRARLVTYEKVPGDAAILPATYVASRWLQPRKGLSFHELARVEWSSVAYPFISEVE